MDNLLNLENGGILGPHFPVVHNHLLCLDHAEGEVVVLAPHGQVSDLLPFGCLVIVSDKAYHFCVICKLNDGVGVVPCAVPCLESFVWSKGDLECFSLWLHI